MKYVVSIQVCVCEFTFSNILVFFNGRQRETERQEAMVRVKSLRNSSEHQTWKVLTEAKDLMDIWLVI